LTFLGLPRFASFCFFLSLFAGTVALLLTVPACRAIAIASDPHWLSDPQPRKRSVGKAVTGQMDGER
jgi:hypothetical protein